MDHQDLHQRATFAIGALSTDPVDLESAVASGSRRTVHETWSGHVLSWDVEIIQVDDVNEVMSVIRDTGEG